MTVPYAFGAATSAIPLSQLDSNFNTPITLGNTAIQLGNTVTTLNNMSLANVTISSGNVTITNVTVTTANATTVNTTTLIATTANVTTGNVTNLISGNVSLTGGSITGTPISGSTGSFTTLTTSGTVTLNGGVANGVAYLDGSKVLTTGSALTFDGTNFGVGISTPSALIHARKDQTAATYVMVDNAGAVNANTSAGFACAELGSVSAFFRALRDGSGNVQLYNVANAGLLFGVNSSEQMRLTSTGLGIGTSSPSYKLDVQSAGTTVIRSYASAGNLAYVSVAGNAGVPGTSSFDIIQDGSSNTFLYNRSNTYMAFGTNNTERARIDSSGNLLVGTTNASATAGSGLKVLPESNGVNGPQIAIVTAASANTTSSLSLYSTGAGAYRFYVADGGTIYATSTSITGISDQRLKENIQDIDVGLDAIMALKPRKFDWKAGKGKDKKGDRGWIAQEFEQVFPDMIDEWKDPAPEGEEPYKAVRADLIPVLVKAIQELKAEFDAYKATHS